MHKIYSSIALQDNVARIRDDMSFECRFLDKSKIALDDHVRRASVDGVDVLAFKRSENAKWARLVFEPGDKDPDSCVIAFQMLFSISSELRLGTHSVVKVRLATTRADSGETVAIDGTLRSIELHCDTLYKVGGLWLVDDFGDKCKIKILVDIPVGMLMNYCGSYYGWIKSTSEHNLANKCIHFSFAKCHLRLESEAASLDVLHSIPAFSTKDSIVGWILQLDGGRDLEISCVSNGQSVFYTLDAGGIGGALFETGFYSVPVETRFTSGLNFLHLRRKSGPAIFSLAVNDCVGRGDDFGPILDNDASSNIVSNPDFLHWPVGLKIDVQSKFTETARDWYVDFRRGTRPSVHISATEIFNAGEARGTYGVRVAAQGIDPSTFVRLVGLLKRDSVEIGDYYFSCGLRLSPHLPANSLAVAEIFLGKIEKVGAGSGLKKLVTLKTFPGLQRAAMVNNVRFGISEKIFSSLAVDEELCVAFDFRGEGELVLFSPVASKVRRRPNISRNGSGSFEDSNIEEQSKKLVLSSIWSPKKTFPVGEVSEIEERVQRYSERLKQIVIPVYNAASDLESCVGSVLATCGNAVEIILADDGSSYYTQSRLEHLQTLDKRIRVICNGANIGYTRNINRALQQCTSDVVVLMNSDVVVTQGWLDKLLTALLCTPDTAAAGPVSNAASWQSVPLVKAGMGWATNSLPDYMSIEDMSALVQAHSLGAMPMFPLLNGFCTMFKREALEAVGYFADDIFPRGYGEENDLCLRLGQLGYVLRVADNCYVHHSKSKSFGAVQRNELSRQANVLLRKRHPYVNFERLEATMRDSRALSELRTNLTGALKAERYWISSLESAE